ncbi:aldehyde dehydrogenase family protein [Bombella sp. ESL0387]|nr:aldehyde dehydrogenase family protein [Bombella sp. ESL0387]
MAFATVNPYTNEVVKEFPEATEQDVQAALARGHEAYEAWRETSFEERAKLMKNIGALLRRDAEKLARLAALEMGKVLAEGKAEAILSAQICEYYAENLAELLEPEDLKLSDPKMGRAKLVYEPQGIVLAIEPWNFPYYQVLRIVAPQLSAGNAVLLKHAGNLPQCAAACQELVEEAGAPKGLFQNIYMPHKFTEMVLDDPRTCGVALTGSERAGSIVAGAAGKALKKATMELGGSDAFIVLDDADLEKTVKWAVFGRHWNAGQVCVSAKRIIVVDSLYDRFVELYKKGIAELRAGDPLDPNTNFAPLASQQAADDLREMVEKAVKQGAKAETIPVAVPNQGAFFQPVVLTELDENNEARHWEFFGPVSQLYRAKDENDAVRIANDSPYGLGGAIFSRDEARAVRVASKIRTGMVFINHPTTTKAELPFGGIARSGYGRELMSLGIKEFVNHKLVNVMDIDSPF